MMFPAERAAPLIRARGDWLVAINSLTLAYSSGSAKNKTIFNKVRVSLNHACDSVHFLRQREGNLVGRSCLHVSFTDYAFMKWTDSACSLIGKRHFCC